MEALVTGPGREPAQQIGRTACHRIVAFPTAERPARPGELVAVRIDAARHHSLIGTRIDGDDRATPPRRSALRVLASG